MTANDTITKAERGELQQVVRLRAKVARNGIDARKAGLVADFEEQLAAVYPPDDPRWKDVTAAAAAVVREADEKIAAICEEVGVRPEFRPGINISWYRRGENADASRRAELRKVAVSRADALARAAKVQIDAEEARLRGDLVSRGLTTAEAKSWEARLPTVEQLMPTLSLAEIEGPKEEEHRDDSDRADDLERLLEEEDW